jgi:hypothetical protein
MLIRFLLLLTLLLPVNSYANEQCKTRALLGKDVASAINEGLPLERINFFFPNAQTPEEIKLAMAWAEDLKLEVVNRMEAETDLFKLTEGIYSDCVKKSTEKDV